jgi:putative tricarboxylic transport membrane protein
MSGDFFQGLLWLFIGLVVVFLSSQYTIGTLSDPGPGALPFGLGLVFVLLSMILLFQSFRIKNRENEKHLPFGPRRLKVFLIILFLGLIIVLLESLGYLLSIFLMISFSMLIMEPKRWLSALLLGVIASYSSYMLFDVWLKVQLPKGLFHF